MRSGRRNEITDAAIQAAAELADRYISDRFLPDKAIDLVDEAGARLRIRRMTAPPELRELAKSCAAKLGFSVHEGVYFFMPGPQFETPAEIRAIRLLGGDAVGMSTVTEALTAAHCGLPLLGISVITNMAAGITGEAVSGEEVNETGAAVAERFSRYLEKILEEMDV